MNTFLNPDFNDFKFYGPNLHLLIAQAFHA